MQGFSRVTSALISAQAGLYTTGHNVSNAQTEGYSRQRANYADSHYQTVGYNGSGALKLGLGSHLTSILQLRDEFLDKTYRKATSKGSFYGIKETSLTEIETILGELYGDSRLSDSIDQLWSSLNDLITHPDGYETRATFISSVVMFMDKASNISNQLYEYQLTINEEVKSSVNRINEISAQIFELNKKIIIGEAAGDHANDLRDTRNLLLDELAHYGEISVQETPEGSVLVLMEGKDLVSQGHINLLGLRYTSENCPFVEPVFNSNYVKDGKILAADKNAMALFANLETARIGSQNDSDNGSLKALLLVRGEAQANYTTTEKSIKNYTIPTLQRNLDTLVNKIVTLLNDSLAPRKHDPDDAPYGLDGSQFVELFSRKYVPRYDETTGAYIEEDPADPLTLYSISNIQINKDVLNDFNKICLSVNKDDKADTSVLEKLLAAWSGDGDPQYMPRFNETATPMSFSEFYRRIIANIGEEGSTAKVFVEAQNKIVNDTSNSRLQISGVSLDEEMTEMMKFQHAYNAASRMISIIDTMLDTVVNRIKA